MKKRIISFTAVAFVAVAAFQMGAIHQKQNTPQISADEKALHYTNWYGIGMMHAGIIAKKGQIWGEESLIELMKSNPTVDEEMELLESLMDELFSEQLDDEGQL